MHFLCISSTCNLANSRVPENRQTENLGDFGGFQPSGMPTFQILRFAEIEINPCNSTSNTGTKKAEWRVTKNAEKTPLITAQFSISLLSPANG